MVDDKSVRREVLRKALEAFGQCEEAEDGREARAAFKQARKESSPFDLLFEKLARLGFDRYWVLATPLVGLAIVAVKDRGRGVRSKTAASPIHLPQRSCES